MTGQAYPELPPRLAHLAGTPACAALLKLMAAGKRLRRLQVGRDRVYVLDGHDGHLISVSTALQAVAKPALIGWARETALQAVRQLLLEGAEEEPVLLRDPETVDGLISRARAAALARRDEAAALGTALHQLIEEHIWGREPVVPPELAHAYAAYLEWEQETDMVVLLSELPVYSLEHRYAGTVDAIGLREGSLVALDWKSTGGIYIEHALQVAAYAQALEEMTGLTVQEAWVVRLAREQPRFEARRVRDWRRALEGFLSALTLFRHLRTEHLEDYAGAKTAPPLS
jgi:hypothetical protein